MASPNRPSSEPATADTSAETGPNAVEPSWSGARPLALWVAVLLVVTAWATWPLLTARTASEVAGPSGVRLDPGEVYNPVLSGEPLPNGFRQVLPRDAILPVYDPVFVSAAESGWDGAAEVIGVEIDGEARAYPVSFLNGREMVIDEIADVPIVVTW